VTVLKAALNHAWKAGHVASDDAWRQVKPFKGVETALRYLSEAECVRLVNACEPAFRNLVRGAMLTGWAGSNGKPLGSLRSSAITHRGKPAVPPRRAPRI
jgi:hypothetical protein